MFLRPGSVPESTCSPGKPGAGSTPCASLHMTCLANTPASSWLARRSPTHPYPRPRLRIISPPSPDGCCPQTPSAARAVPAGQHRKRPGPTGPRQAERRTAGMDFGDLVWFLGAEKRQTVRKLMSVVVAPQCPLKQALYGRPDTNPKPPSRAPPMVSRALNRRSLPAPRESASLLLRLTRVCRSKSRRSLAGTFAHCERVAVCVQSSSCSRHVVEWDDILGSSPGQSGSGPWASAPSWRAFSAASRLVLTFSFFRAA